MKKFYPLLLAVAVWFGAAGSMRAADEVCCYFNNTAGWSDVYVWAWDASSTQLSASTTWPGEKLTQTDENGYYVWSTTKGMPTQIIFSTNNGDTKAGGGDLSFRNGKVYDCDGNISNYGGGGDDPIEPFTGLTIYYDNSATQFSPVNIHYWSSPSTTWPGETMEQYDGDIYVYTFTQNPANLSGFLFCNGGAGAQTADFTQAPIDGHLYKGAGGTKGAVTDMGPYNAGPVKPTVTANPASGKKFAESITVTLTSRPQTTIYYTTDGSTPSAASKVYSAPLTFTQTTTLKTFVENEAGSNVQEFVYTKKEVVEPTPGSNLITDYYKVNPDGKVGSNKTINATFTKLNNDNRMCVADNAMSNWTNDELIAQGVARDIASAIRGKHEYPVVDSYAIYAAYDSQNLYLGVQYVYTVWDIYGDGKLTNGAAKPYNMDGRLMLAFDLDPYSEMDGVLTDGNTIWDADGKYNTFANGTDCILLCSTKSTVGVPGLFFATDDGHASYSAPYCVGLEAPFYGCADGLLPCIDHIWGQKDLHYDPDMLTGNDNFVDLINEIPKDQHTFYEYKLPLSKLGITEDYIKNTGIGVMVIDTYGQGAIGATPYDPTCFDNAQTPYSKDKSSSAEKEDMDCFTYAHARIGKLAGQSGVESIVADADANAPAEYYNLQGVRVANPSNGIYIMRRGNKATKVLVK